MAQEKSDLFNELIQRRHNVKLSFALKVLRAFGFQQRMTKKNHIVLRHGSQTLTLPGPHGRDPVLKVSYVQLIKFIIEQTEDLNPEHER